MLVGATLLCVWVTLTRDWNAKRVYLTSATDICDRIREHWDRTQTFPPELDVSRQGRDRWVPPEHYADDDTRFFAARMDEPVILAYTPMAQMFVTYNARGVVFFEQGKFTVEWVREGRFQRLLAAQERRIEALAEACRSRPPVLPGAGPGRRPD
jgi:hypothetical protein